MRRSTRWAGVAGLMLIASTTLAQSPAPGVVKVSAGAFVAGSTHVQREAAYVLDEKAYGHSVTRTQRWYDNERASQTLSLPEFFITKNLITNAQYALFVQDTGHRAPKVREDVWKSYGLIHPWSRTRRHTWADEKPPAGREQHPVVLVSHADANAYARWLSSISNERWRLPTDLEWEKAARGSDGRAFAWGNEWRPDLLNSHDRGPFDTIEVGSFKDGASPWGVLDMAGQVFEWTATLSGSGRHVVKGGSWDDSGCGVCRAAASHGRPDNIKHILIGFRLVRQ